MTDAPRISVLLPVRDAEATVEVALASCTAQTGVDLEVVVVDDGSGDASPRILSRIAAADPRVRIVTTPPRGIVAALETARRTARGRVLARMDADDVALPGRFATQLAALEADPALGVVGGHVRIVPRSGLTRGRRRYEAWLNGLTDADEVERDLFVECPLAHPTWMLRREAVEAVGGYRDRGWPEDHDLLFRLREGGWRLGVVSEVVLDWTDHPERLSRRDPAYGLDAFVRCRVHHLPRLHPRARAGVIVCGAGPVGKAFARALSAEGLPLQAFVEVDPRKIGQEIHGVPVLAYDRFEPGEALVVAAVAGGGPRDAIRRELVARGLAEGRDFVAVA